MWEAWSQLYLIILKVFSNPHNSDSVWDKSEVHRKQCSEVLTPDVSSQDKNSVTKEFSARPGQRADHVVPSSEGKVLIS